MSSYDIFSGPILNQNELHEICSIPWAQSFTSLMADLNQGIEIEISLIFHWNAN